MIQNVTLGVKAPEKTWKSELSKFKEMKDALRRQKMGLPPDDIKLEDIPF
jgi:hypothetical protein